MAWNVFARLLQVDWSESFQCSRCGRCPAVVICDGTSLGFKKEYLASYSNTQEAQSVPIIGSFHENRVTIKDAKTRKLLMRYAKGDEPLSIFEFSSLLSSVAKQLQSLDKFIKSLHSPVETTFKSPSHCTLLLKNLSFNGPACALFQGTTSSELEYLKDVLSTTNIMESHNHQFLEYIQLKVPAVGSLIAPLSRTSLGYAQEVLCNVISRAENAFSVGHNEDTPRYPPPADDEWFKDLSFFPVLKQIHG